MTQADSIDAYPGVNQYLSVGVRIYIANRPSYFPAGTHVHPEYEFVMPLDECVHAECDGQPIVMEKAKLMPFNPWQRRGTPQETTIARMVCIGCTRETIERLALQGFGSAQVVFEPVSFEMRQTLHLLIGLFIQENLAQEAGCRLMQDNLVEMLLIEIIRRSRNNLTANHAALASTADADIARAIDFLREQVCGEFHLQEAARVAGLSPYYFIRAFKKHTGTTPYAFYLDCKIERAKALLSTRSISIMEIALSTGFNNAGHFSTLFKRKTGLTPSEYQKIIF